ncbi:hypothetical protein IX329_002390 [Fusobacterium necrophorum]|nr:hypothetical protein [Fusobacterium necrophorum]MBR8790951.1 hypothetical protein [Fusobacterium necrophorum]
MNKIGNIKGIDFVKAFAIITVLILHLNVPEIYDRKVFSRVYTEIGVPIFMIITGHNYILSYCKSKEDWLNKNNLSKKLKRILIPYIYILIFEIIVIFIESDFIRYDFSQYRNIKEILYLIFFRGGLGPGGYYPPVLIQIVLIYFPLLLVYNRYMDKLIKNKYKNIITLLLIFTIEGIYEIIIYYLGHIYNIDDFYRMSALRYTPFLQLGIILYYNKDKILENFKMILPLSLCGGGYIYLTYYKDLIFPPFYNWKQVATPTMFYALFFVYIGLKYFNNINENFLGKIITTIGKATYHIFLIQLVYYGVFRIKRFDNIYFGVHILICLVVGVLFYYIEPRIKNIWIV